MQFSEFQPGRRFIGRLPHNKDLITSIEQFAKENNIEMATFSVIGAVSSATFGFYDQKQQVYVSSSEKKSFEIASCQGNISLKDGQPFAHVHAVLADEEGKGISGHIFSETLIFAGEIDIQELQGKSFHRKHDEITGLMLWDI